MENPKRYNKRRMVLAILALSSLAAASVALFVGFQPSHATVEARVELEYDLRAICRGLALLADADPESFQKLPINIGIDLSEDLLRRYPSLLQYYTNSSGARYATGDGLVDAWGHKFHFIVTSKMSTKPAAPTFQITAWSDGRNGHNEETRGDDVSQRSDLFSLKVGVQREP